MDEEKNPGIFYKEQTQLVVRAGFEPERLRIATSGSSFLPI